MRQSAEYWINKLSLQKHPEGGYFKETYRSSEVIEMSALPNRYNDDRSVSTAIYFMITSDSHSKFHKVNSDEIWFYHAGGTAKIVAIDENGNLIEHKFGTNLDNQESPQVLVPKNTWFAAFVTSGEYVLLSCTVAPGFDFSDFELAKRDYLVSQYPEHSKLINELT